MDTRLFADTFFGTYVTHHSREGLVILTVAVPGFGKHTVRLDLDDVERLLALYEHAVDPIVDLTEHFSSTYHVVRAERMARAFVCCARELGELIEAQPKRPEWIYG